MKSPQSLRSNNTSDTESTKFSESSQSTVVPYRRNCFLTQINLFKEGRMRTDWPDADMKAGVRVLAWRWEGARVSGWGGVGVLIDVQFSGHI